MIRIDLKKKWDSEIIKVKGKSCINKSIYEIGLIVEGQAKVLAARRYGYLAASINVQYQGGGTELGDPSSYAKEKVPSYHKVETFRKIEVPDKDNIVLVGTALDYAPHVEFGTIKMDAQPFLRSAADLAQGKVLDIVKIEAKKHFLGYLIEHEKYVRSRGK